MRITTIEARIRDRGVSRMPQTRDRPLSTDSGPIGLICRSSRSVPRSIPGNPVATAPRAPATLSCAPSRATTLAQPPGPRPAQHDNRSPPAGRCRVARDNHALHGNVHAERSDCRVNQDPDHAAPPALRRLPARPDIRRAGRGPRQTAHAPHAGNDTARLAGAECQILHALRRGAVRGAGRSKAPDGPRRRTAEVPGEEPASWRLSSADRARPGAPPPNRGGGSRSRAARERPAPRAGR
jgi:hypothetical protein